MARYHDISLYGEENPDGSAKELFDDDCIGNALVLWLTSRRGDFILSPTTGGILEDMVFKNMSNLNIELLVFKLQTEILLTYSDILSLSGIQVIPNYTERFLEIKISYQIISTKKDKTATIYIDTAIKPEKFVYEDVLYTGQNLESFVLVTKSTMKGKVLQWNFDENSFVWGRFRLINLTDSDPYFSRILQTCNGIV